MTVLFYLNYELIYLFLKFFIAFYCGQDRNITNLTSCYLQTSIFENVIHEKNLIFSTNGQYVTSLNSRTGKIIFVFASPKTSFLKYISFKIINNAEIIVQINGVNDLVR
jgi:hypothetical protein